MRAGIAKPLPLLARSGGAGRSVRRALGAARSVACVRLTMAAKQLRVLLVAAKDLAGGAHRSAFRLHQALRLSGVDSVLAVREKASSDPHVHELTPAELGWPPRGRGFFDRLPMPCLTSRDDPISLGLQSIRLDRVIERFGPDIVHLHWINGGMVSIAAAAAVCQPVVWTLHDMWAFTGGCHYAGDCAGFREACASCPKVKPWPIVKSVPRFVLAQKTASWGTRRLNAVAPSRWMAAMARESALFANADIRQIDYCVDPEIFHPALRDATRAHLGIPASRRCVLFVNASQPRKGARIIGQLIDEMMHMPAWREREFLFAGGLPDGLTGAEPHVRLLPPTHDEGEMAGFFAAADLFVMPSLEDNLPNAVIESLACGTPVAAFAIGGIPEMITAGENGYLTEEASAAGMAQLLRGADLDGLHSRDAIARDAAKMFSQVGAARLHAAFYEQLLQTPCSP